MGELYPIKGFEDYYAITKSGDIFSYRSNKFLKRRLTINGYNRIALSKGGKYHYIMVHRIVASMFISGYKEGLEVNHINGNKLDNRVENLEWVTKSQNVAHAFKNNLYKPRGSSKEVGVHYCNTIKRWISKIMKQGNRVYLGSFLTEKEAIAARKGAVS